MQDEKQWDVVSLLKASSDFFTEKNVDDARLNAELLLAHTLRLRRLDLYLYFDRPVSEKERAEFRELCRRRLKGEPLQYITGEQEFYGYPFFVDKRVLVPRPETELLVEAAIETVESLSDAPEIRILDIGTGSGCIAVTFAKKLPNARITAVDLSADALDVARRNAEMNEVSGQITFLETDALSSDFSEQFKEPFDLIISNPPYIPEREAETLQIEVRDYEPHAALFVTEGFEFYEKISRDAKVLLKPGGHLFFELHADGAARVKAIFERLGFSNIQILKDYSGILRMALAQKP